jgi:hypothetical protein
MRRAPLAALLLLVGGCTVHGRDPSATRPSIGVLVQASAGRCTTVLTRSVPRRVCAPGGKGAAPADTSTPDTARATR